MNNYKVYANIVVLAVYNMRFCAGDEESATNYRVNEEKYIFFCLCMGILIFSLEKKCYFSN
jgi:hypothetical protein